MEFSELQDAEEGLPPRQRRQLGADSLGECAAAAAAPAWRAPRGRHGLVAVPRRPGEGMGQGWPREVPLAWEHLGPFVGIRHEHVQLIQLIWKPVETYLDKPL